MAENGVREVVGNPLAFNPREQAPDRSLPLQGVRGNSSTDNALFRESGEIVGAMSGLRRVLRDAADQAQEQAVTQGKIDFMSGVTELQMREQGDYYRMQGYESLNAVNKANQWYATELQNLEGAGADMSPEQYREHLNGANAKLFESLPDDPMIRSIYTAAFADTAPRLAAQHIAAHSDRNYARTESEVGSYMQAGGRYSSDFSRRTGPSDFTVSDSVVSQVYESSDARDRDIAIKTMLGEAGGESDQGLAAVAHVMLNRTRDSRWGGSIADVALAPKQFSTWNEGAGGNNPGRYKPGSPAYERAGRIYDTVISGKHIDPTNGATHYYSPAGMDLLVREGSQNNRIPRWLQQERDRSGGEVRLGGHIFVGKSNGNRSNAPRPQGPQLEDAPNDAGPQDAEGRLNSIGQGDVDSAHEGIPTEHTTPQASSEFQTFLREQNGRLKPGRTAAMLADTIATQLSVGDTTAFDNSGGIAFLQELGASPEDINKVIRAQEAYTNKQDQVFNEDREMFRRDVIDLVKENPGMDYETEVLPLIRNGLQAGLITDAGARQLSNEAANAMAAEGRKSMKDNPELVNAVNRRLRAFSNLDPATMTDEEYTAATEAEVAAMEQLAKDFGANPSDVSDFIGRVHSAANQTYNRMETEVQREQQLARENRARSNEVDNRIAAGQGTQGLTGRIKYKDQEYDSDGYYVARLRNSIAENTLQQYGQEYLQENVEQIAPSLNREMYTQLIRAGVTDAATGAQMGAAIRGPIVAADGTINEAAANSFDLYMQISRLEGGNAYLTKMIDPEAKALYDSAASVMGGDVSIEQALRMMKEKEQRIREDPSYTRELDTIFERDLSINASKAKNAALSGGWISSILGNDVEANAGLLAQSDAHIENWLKNKATILQSNNPILNAETALKSATDALEEQSVVVGSNFVIASRPELRLDRVMGVESYGRQAPDRVINEFINEQGEAIWGQLWRDRHGGVGWQDVIENGKYVGRQLGSREAGYYVTSVTQPDGTTAVSVALLKNKNNPGEGFVGMPYVIPDAAALGKQWVDRQNQPTAFGGMVNSIRNFFGRTAPAAAQQIREDNPVEEQRDIIRDRLGF